MEEDIKQKLTQDKIFTAGICQECNSEFTRVLFQYRARAEALNLSPEQRALLVETIYVRFRTWLNSNNMKLPPLQLLSPSSSSSSSTEALNLDTSIYNLDDPMIVSPLSSTSEFNTAFLESDSRSTFDFDSSGDSSIYYSPTASISSRTPLSPNPTWTCCDMTTLSLTHSSSQSQPSIPSGSKQISSTPNASSESDLQIENALKELIRKYIL